MICPNCSFDNPPNMRFCGACGASLTVACAECGFANPLDFRFCGMCGKRLSTEHAVPSVEQPALLTTQNVDAPVTSPAPPFEGERHVVTVVLTDLTDSTSL